MLFALALLPVMTFVGVAVDYSIANNRRTKLQSALDNALLAGAIAGKKVLDDGSGTTAAINAANVAAASFFSANADGITASLTTSYTQTGFTISGTGSVSATMPTIFLKIVGTPEMSIATTASATSAAQPYLDVYLLIDISASMLLPSTDAGITRMVNGHGCALACHDKSNGTDSYRWAQQQGIELRYEVVNQGVENLLTFLGNNPGLKSHVRVGLWSFDDNLTRLTAPTLTYSTVADNFPAPALATTDASAATPFDSLIGNFVTTVGTSGDGSTAARPQKMVIIATDGVNDPTREWVSKVSLRSQVKVFDTGFCKSFEKNGVTVAIINTPYYPMDWDWGYNATLGQPGSLGGATRVDDIPIALRKCAGKFFTVASDAAAIRAAFTKLFLMASPLHLTK